MTTVFIRGGGEPIEDDITPSVPRLAELAGRMTGLPLCIDRQLYMEAEAEMVEIRRQRGYGWIETASLPQRNFLLFGIPVVCED